MYNQLLLKINHSTHSSERLKKWGGDSSSLGYMKSEKLKRKKEL